MESKVTSIDNVKPGVRFVIKKKPKFWDSKANSKSPMASVSYPYSGVIKDVIRVSPTRVAMDDGQYGWDVLALIKTGAFYVTETSEGMKGRMVEVWNEAGERKTRVFISKLESGMVKVENRVDILGKRYDFTEVYENFKIK